MNLQLQKKFVCLMAGTFARLAPFREQKLTASVEMFQCVDDTWDVYMHINTRYSPLTISFRFETELMRSLINAQNGAYIVGLDLNKVYQTMTDLIHTALDCGESKVSPFTYTMHSFSS